MSLLIPEDHVPIEEHVNGTYGRNLSHYDYHSSWFENKKYNKKSSFKYSINKWNINGLWNRRKAKENC